MIKKLAQHEFICQGLNELYATKNVKYDDSFSKSMQEYGPVVLAMRIGDKFNRVKALIKDPTLNTGDESLIDTLKDLANYAIMGMIELNPMTVFENVEVEEEIDEEEIDEESVEKADLQAELEDYTRTELIEIAKQLEITMNKKVNKEEILKLIMSKKPGEIYEAVSDLFDSEDEEVED